MGYQAHNEPRLNTSEGLREPDLIVVKDDVAYVIDAQVVKGSGLNASHDFKVKKYDRFNDPIITRYGVSWVEHYLPNIFTNLQNWR